MLAAKNSSNDGEKSNESELKTVLAGLKIVKTKGKKFLLCYLIEKLITRVKISQPA